MIEGKVLGGLTQSAKPVRWARDRLFSIGNEMGNALGAFAWAFQDHPAVRTIVLASTIAERLGANIPGEDGCEDLLIGSLRDSLSMTLVQRGMSQQESAKIAC